MVGYRTGVLFEYKGSNNQGESLETILVSTTADLTESGGGGCLGTMLIAMVSVVTLVSYSLIRYQKKKRRKKSIPFFLLSIFHSRCGKTGC
jgi:hypothetical protein